MKTVACFLTLLFVAFAATTASAQRPSVSSLLQSIEDLQNRVTVLEVNADRSWSQQGTLADIDTITTNFPAEEYEYGIRYLPGLGQIQAIVINGWNLGLRISTTTPVWSGDDSTQMSLVYNVFTRGLIGQTPNDWYHQYYRQDANGRFAFIGGNGITNGVAVFVRRR